MANIFKISQPVRVGNFSANPADVSAGAIYWNTSSNELFVANGSSYSQLAISTNEFLSNVFRINDNTNPTKQLAFDVSNVSASTVRSLIMPDANVNLGALTDSNISASAAIAYSKLALSNSIVNADVNASAAIAYSKLALSNSIVNADVNASAAIAYSKLDLTLSIVNGDISASAAIAYSKLSLSNSIVNADINASAAIAYSKLNLSASIVNADVSASAAIAYSKLAALTASRALVSDGSGVVSVSSVTSTELGYVSGVTSAIQAQLNTKLSSVSQDSAPTLGGDLTIAANAFIGVVRRGSSNVASVQEEYLDSLSLTQSTTAVQSSLTFDSRNFKGVSVDYTISNGNDRRKGRLDIACNNVPTVASSSVSLVDQSTETADILVSWSAAINGNNVELSYTTGAGTFNMDADIKRFRS